MGLGRGQQRNCRWAWLAATLVLLVGACASGPPLATFDLTAAKPPKARPLPAQIRIGDPVATLDLDSDRILVRNGQNLELLPGVRWPQQLSSLFRARLVEAFQNAGLTRYLAGDGASAQYELDIDIRAFELDAQTNEAHVDVAARIVALQSGLVAAVDLFSVREPVSSGGPGAVAMALNQASAIAMTKIVAFVDQRL
ncbi:MAG: membrane integrity-associated transporter subunit PqiC [Candidatus Eremiobacteraeota bacterium]|nr:membrane integrity-associated transporter subunit PqiC [Candidatus Eremiobacteraeota bacterium]